MNKVWNVIKRKLKEQRRTVLYYSIGLFIYAWTIIAIYPTMKDKVEFDKVFDAFPEEVTALLGAGGVNMAEIEGFLTLEYLAIFFVLILAFFVAGSAGSTIAGAIERKTMDFQLSQPISRTTLLLSEASVTVIYTILLVAFNSAAMWILAQFYDVELCLKGIIAFTILASALMISIYGISILLSSILRSRAVVITTTLFLILTMHIFQSLTAIVETLKDYDHITLFYMYKPEPTLINAELDLTHMSIFFVIFVLGLFLATIIFNQKDIA